MTEVTSPAPADTRSTFYSLASSLRSHLLTTGDIAGLRRMDPARLDAGGFWKLAGLHLDSFLPGEAMARHRAEIAWGAVIVALATMGDLQDTGERLGRSLAQAGYSESRFTRLLRSDHERRLDEIPQMARFLAAKQQPADLVDAAILVVGSEVMRDASSRNLARDYYSQLSANR